MLFTTASWAWLIYTDCWPFLALLTEYAQIEAFSGRIKETSPGHFQGRDRLQRLVMIGIALTNDCQEAGAGRGVESLVLGVEEQIVDVLRNDDAGHVFSVFAVNDHDGRLVPHAQEDALVGHVQ